MTIGEQIRAARKAKGLSQEALAASLGISRQAVTRWESGQSAPSTANLLRLEQLLDFSISALAGVDASNGTQPPEPLQPEQPRKRILCRPRLYKQLLIGIGVLLGYAAIYLAARLFFAPMADYSLFGWLFGNTAARRVGYLYGWLCQRQLFPLSLLISVIPTLCGRWRFGVTTLTGFGIGILLGELLGSNPAGEAIGAGHYGWLIWGAVFLFSILLGGILEWIARRRNR